MQFPTVLTLRRFTNFSRARTWSFHSDRKADKLSSLNDDTVLRTGDLLMRNRREDRTMATREINFQFVGGGHARKCILHRVTCRDRILTRRRAFLRVCWSPDVETTVEGKNWGGLPSHVLEKKRTRKVQRFAHLECRSERRIMLVHNLSIPFWFTFLINLPIMTTRFYSAITYVSYLPGNKVASCRRKLWN